MGQYSHIRAFIFDMDGTLIDSMRYWRGENRRFLARYGLPVPEGLEQCIDTYSSHAFARRMAQDYPDRFTYEGVVSEYEKTLLPLYAREIPAKPGAAELLSRLEERGRVLCVATATRRPVATMALDRLGLLEKLDLVTDGSELGVGKGDAQYFVRLAARLGVEPRECALFEDSLYAMKGGAAAGLTVFAIEEGVYLPDAATMQSIRETARFLVRDFYEAWDALKEEL